MQYIFVEGNMAFTKKQVGQILDRLRDEYPEAGCALEHKNKYELIICVVLSAQTTDKSVNKISDALFEKYPTPYDLAQAEQEDVIDIIRTIGMYKTKSKNIIALAKALVADFDGQVPGDYDQLIKLPGVGRKTANVVMSCAFGEDAIAVDTHVFRVTNRLGLADAPDVLKTEQQLMQNIPKKQWSRAHHWLIYHGRRVCAARKPDCEHCTLREWCDYANGNPKGKK